MNDARYQELLGLLLDGEMSEEQAAEFAAGLRARPELLDDLRTHLRLWEIWSQQDCPERTAESFLAAWRTRLAAEGQADSFERRVHERLAAEQTGNLGNASSLWAWLSMRRAWLAGAALVALLATALWWHFGQPPIRPSDAGAPKLVTLTGEAVCTACTLHESQQHSMAVRTRTGAATNIVYLRATNELTRLQPKFCAGPAAVTATGWMAAETPKQILAARTIELNR